MRRTCCGHLKDGNLSWLVWFSAFVDRKSATCFAIKARTAQIGALSFENIFFCLSLYAFHGYLLSIRSVFFCKIEKWPNYLVYFVVLYEKSSHETWPSL